MTNTGATPTQLPAALTGEQQAAADAHERAAAKDRLIFALADTTLPLLNQNVSLGALRYYLGLAIDQVIGSPDGLIVQGH